MSTFNPGDKVREVGYPSSSVMTVVVGEPDAQERIVVSDCGRYQMFFQDDLVKAPKRYVVERRAPKDEETYFRLDVDPIVFSDQCKTLVVVEVL